MDQATLEELAPDVAQYFTATTVNNQIDGMPVVDPPTPPTPPTQEQIVALWNLFKEHPKAIERNGGIDKMSRAAGIAPVFGRALIKQFQALVAYRLAETAGE